MRDTSVAAAIPGATPVPASALGKQIKTPVCAWVGMFATMGRSLGGGARTSRAVKHGVLDAGSTREILHVRIW